METKEDKWLRKSLDLTKMVSFTAHHDMKGAAAGIRFGVETLCDMVPEEVQENLQIREVLEILALEVKKQDLILEGIEDWLSLIKGENQSWTQVDFNVLIKDLINAERYKGQVIATSLPTLYVSKGQFASLFDNLIRNGLHYNDSEQPTIKIYEEAGSIVVQDNGNGFDIRQFEVMCQPFHRLDTSRKGTGLGMTIVRAVCSNHQFEFKAESEPGVGSRFIIQYTNQ